MQCLLGCDSFDYFPNDILAFRLGREGDGNSVFAFPFELKPYNPLSIANAANKLVILAILKAKHLFFCEGAGDILVA